jgi:hypothetical protein
MAEALGVVASIVQVAGAGLQLSKTLYLYADGVATADRRLRDIAKEIKLTSCVVEELGNVFKNDETAALISNNALKTANETIRECSAVFAEIEITLKKSKKNTFGRLMLPFRDAKIELLRSHIDKLKSTLQLLMQVLTHAYHVASQKLDRETEAKEREEIRQLLQRRNDCTEKYERSLRSFDGDIRRTTDDTTQSATDNADVHSFHDSGVSVAAIGRSMTATALASCVQHVRSLLKDLETLQENLRASSNGDDQSQHYQNLTNSYLRARGSLDHVLAGSMQKSNDKADCARRDDESYAPRRVHGSTSRSRSREGRRSEKWEQAAKASRVAQAVEAFRSRNTGAWTSARSQRLATSAIGAAGIEGLIDRDLEKHEKRHVAESALGGLLANRVANGSRSRSRVRQGRSTAQSRSRSRSLFPRSRSRSRRGAWTSDHLPRDRDGNRAIDRLEDLEPPPPQRRVMDLQPALNKAAAPMVVSPKPSPSPLIYDRPNVDFTPFGDDIFADHQAASLGKKKQRGDDLNYRGSASVHDTQGVNGPHTGQDVSDIRRHPRKALVQTEGSSFEPDKNASDSEPAPDGLLDSTLPKDHIRGFVDERWELGERNSVSTPPAAKSSPSPPRIRPPITYGEGIPLGQFNASSSNVLEEKSQYAASQSELVHGHRRRHYSDRIDIASDDSDEEAAAGWAAIRMAEERERSEIEEPRGPALLFNSYSSCNYPQVDEVDALLRKWTVNLN